MVICHIEHSVLLLVCLHDIQVCSYPSHQSLLISHFKVPGHRGGIIGVYNRQAQEHDPVIAQVVS